MHFLIRVGGFDDETLALRLAPYEFSGVSWNGRTAHVFTDSLEQARCVASEFQVAFEAVLDRNWSEQWQWDWQPLLIGRSFFLYPPGYGGEFPPGRIALEMIPGNVFGGGDHPTTQLCLEALEDLVRPGMRVADIGAGTAILKRAAQRLGASAVACDIDPAAAPYVDYLGSANALASNAFDLVVANIHPGVLRDLHADLRRLGGTLVLSGFLPEQGSDIIRQFGPPKMLRQRSNWGLYIGDPCVTI